MKSTFITILLCLITFGKSFSQVSLSGHVSDATSGEMLPGVHVYIQEINKGTATDAKGYFQLDNLPQCPLTIRFSYIGYKTEYYKDTCTTTHEQVNISLHPTIIRQEEVVISAGFSNTQHQNAIQIDFMDNQEAFLQGTSSLNQILTDLPGVDMISKSPGVSQPTIRGLSGSNILVLNNGVRLENFQFSVNHPFMIDEYGNERVEVIKGPASLLYGSDAIGGVINVIKELPAPVNSLKTDFHGRYFSNTQGINSSVGIKSSTNKWHWGIRGSYKNHADYMDGNGDYVPNSRFNSQSMRLFTGLTKSFGTLKLAYDYHKYRLGMTVNPVLALIRERGRNTERWYQNLDNHLITSRNILFLGGMKTELNLGLQVNHRQLIKDPKETMPLVNTTMTTFNYEVKGYHTLIQNLQLISGIQGMYRNNTNNDGENKILPDANLSDIAGFTLLQYKVINNLNLQGGIRYDFRHLDVPLQERGHHSHGEAGHTEEEEHIEMNRNFNNFSGSCGLTWQVTTALLIRSNLASAFRAPNLAELTQAGVHAGRHEEGNPDLIPQRSYEADLSLHIHTHHISFDLSGFRNQINHFIYLSPTGEVENNLPVYQYQQENATLTGGEAGIHYHPAQTSWLHLKATGSYNVAQQENNEHLPFIAPFRGKTELMLKAHKWHTWNDLFFKSEWQVSADQDNPSPFETYTPGYYLINLGFGATRKWKKTTLSWQIAVRNLLNRQYIDHLSTLKPLGMLNPGRDITAGINVSF
ncbi:TonB-dependent receptor [Marinilabiliaceae bacterium JC017]|nr:TonB-dependent receptor [Marinilabiliaceae bacterium JC017]